MRSTWFTKGLWLLLGGGIITRCMKLSLMEFKADELYFIQQSIAHPFAPALHSSVAIPHPPTFSYVLSLITTFTADPLHIAAGIVIINIVALWLFYLLCQRLWSSQAALMSTALLASMPWAVIFSRKIWNPDIIIPLQILFLLTLESLVRDYKPWKLFVCTLVLSIYAQVHLLALVSIIPVITVILLARLPIRASHGIGAITLLLFTLLPYLFFGIGSDIAAIPSASSIAAPQSLGFSYLLGASGYSAFTTAYHLQWVSSFFIVFACIAVLGAFWTFSEQYFKDTRSPATIILTFFALWSALLIAILHQSGTLYYPHYWISILLVFPLCIGSVAHKAPRCIFAVVAVQIAFMLSFYSFIERYPEKITGDYGVPYIFQQIP